MAEALLLAQCGEPQLWNRTQEMFFKRQAKRYPFLNVLHAVIKSDLMQVGRYERDLLDYLRTFSSCCFHTAFSYFLNSISQTISVIIS